ncbi:MAG: acetate uptake transporter [Solirubrobacteraceae bacterium]
MEAAGVTQVSRPTPPLPAATAAPPVAIANPGPLGLAAFALTTFVLSMFNAGLISKGGEPVVLGVALAYGGLGQLLAGMWEFRRGNTFGAVAFSSYGAFWLSYWALVTFYVKGIPAGDAGDAIGLFLIAWGIFTAYMWVASFRTSVGVMLVFLLLTVTFFLLGFGNTGPHPDLVKWGGYFGLATAAVAWYASFAEVMFAGFGRWILPIKPLTRV